ncbi:hypothetical protein NE237_019889 [Protea cynaroides]|uniref:DUF7734 domain-containing protein n=1 Tax=Protea cynaroides TaxID=273540 RepID=A0A9Q0HA46_9MAGN|nr:hypothetical protein NE237_019889 [Protea cynaroides]
MDVTPHSSSSLQQLIEILLKLLNGGDDDKPISMEGEDVEPQSQLESAPLKEGTTCIQNPSPRPTFSTPQPLTTDLLLSMLKQGSFSTNQFPSSFLPFLINKTTSPYVAATRASSTVNVLNLQNLGIRSVRCTATRRRIRYEEDEDDDEDYGHNSDITMLESYSESIRDEVLLVRAMLDDQEEEVLIFKGFSSCLSYRTSPDPSQSVLPARAVIKSINRIKGPYNPSNVEYIEKDITWEAFRSRLLSSQS